MSAWTVEKAHIDTLVNAAAQLGLIKTGPEATALGQMLWKENFRSVNYRYSERKRTPRYTLATTEATFHPAALIKVISCYEYQTCERQDWPKSKAYAFCQSLEKAAEATMPPSETTRVLSRYGGGNLVPAYSHSEVYASTPWGIHSMDQVPLAVAAGA